MVKKKTKKREGEAFYHHQKVEGGRLDLAHFTRRRKQQDKERILSSPHKHSSKEKGTTGRRENTKN